MPEQRAGLSQIIDPLGLEAHDPGRGRVHGYGIVAQDEHSTGLGSSLDGPVALHPHDAVHDRKVRPHGAVDVEDGTGDAGPMENVLGPTVAASRNNAEHVFEGKGRAHPVMGFELGQRNQEVRLENRPWEIKLSQPGGAGLQRDAANFIEIQVHEDAGQRAQEIAQAEGFDDGLGVALVTRPLGHLHGRCPQAQKAFARGSNHGRVGVDDAVGVRFHKVGFQHHSLIAQAQVKFPQGVEDQCAQVHLVAVGPHDSHPRGRPRKGRHQGAFGKAHEVALSPPAWRARFSSPLPARAIQAKVSTLAKKQFRK